VIGGEVGVAHGVFDILVTEYLFLHFIKRKDIAAVHHKVACEGVA